MAGNATALTASTDNNLRAFRRNCVREKLFNLLSPNIVVTAIQMPTPNQLGWTIPILPGMDQSRYAVKNVMNTVLWRGMPGEAIYERVFRHRQIISTLTNSRLNSSERHRN